jgi:hypothetical protein
MTAAAKHASAATEALTSALIDSAARGLRPRSATTTHYFTVTVTHSLRSSDASPRNMNCTSKLVPDRKGAPRSSLKCTAPAPPADVSRVTGGVATSVPVQVPFTLRSGMRETVYTVFGLAPCTLIVISTAKVP